MNREFGIRMSGCEKPIEELIIQYFNSPSETHNPQLKYLEIGAASCVTLRAVYDIFKENIKHNNWQVIGVDIDGGWSIDWEQIKSKFKIDEELEFWGNRLSGLPLTVKKIPNASLWIDKNPRELITKNFTDIDICFIDACHGSNCVINDFLCVKDNIKKNGLVIFHDVGVLEQGTDWQEHCQEFINVREGLNKLGLFDNKYPGWEFVKEIPGSRLWNGDGNSCGVFKKL